LAAIVTNEGEIRIANAIKNITFQKIVLFQNNLTPDENTVYSSLTLATFSGYAAVTPTWGTPAMNGSNQAEMTATPAVFSHSGGGTSNNIYGWAWIDDSLGAQKLIAAERIAGAPKSMSVIGDSITITPKMRDYQE